MTTKTKNTKGKTASKAVAAKKEKPVVVYRERTNRAKPGTKSELGDRKIIYSGVTAVKNNDITETDPKKAMPLDKDRAEKILAKAMTRDDLVGARLYPRKGGERAVWIAFAKDNPGLPKVTA